MKFVVSVILAAALIAGCSDIGGSDDRLQNANEFRDRLEKLDYSVELEPESKAHPGLVIGQATTKDGIDSSFAFTFGPAPEQLPAELEADGAVWVELGDQVNYWIEEFPADVGPMESDRVIDMRFELEDTACQVVADQNCGI